MNIQNNKTLSRSEDRNIGIELLRIVSMMMVVILHCLGHGGVLFNTVEFSTNNNAAWLLEIACFGAVNIYALTTGYVCIKAKHRWSRILELWLEVALYSVLFTVIFYLLPQSTIGTKDIIKSFFPIMSIQYWYFTSYFCLFLFIPFINILISNLSKQQHRVLIFTTICAFCFIALFGLCLGGDLFNLNQGYSFIWLAALYVIGAYLKLYQNDFKRHSKEKYLFIYIICILLVWISRFLMSVVTIKLFGTSKATDLFISYVSPFIVLSSMCLLIFFSQLKIRHGKALIAEISSVSFGVYLISEQRCIRSMFIKNRFVDCVTLPWYLMIGRVLIGAILIYIVCSVIDYVRKRLFIWAHIRPLCEKTIDGIDRLKLRIFAKIKH